ncbi:MAG: hypothetical protein KF902_15150 [Phycisphaeraceae bacterium]|nr:hypothetical protein [Phycisphaeraceae bacterium]
MKTGYLCIVIADTIQEAYRGVARLDAASLLVGEFGARKATLLQEWSYRWDDSDWEVFIKDYDHAIRMAQMYRREDVRTEVVQVSECATEADAVQCERHDGFLGFDIASLRLHSYLNPRPPTFGVTGGPAAWVPIWALEADYIALHLNEHGLMRRYLAARVVCDAVRAMQGLVNPLHPGTYLDERYRVLAVISRYRVEA